MRSDRPRLVPGRYRAVRLARSVVLSVVLSVPCSVPFAAPLFCALAGASAVGCGGTNVTFDGTTYRDRNGGIAFRVPPTPPGWRRIPMADATLAFRDEPRDASILVNARCQDRQADAPLPALTNHLLAGTTEREVSLEQVIPFDGREALHTRLEAKLDGVRMAYNIYVLKKDGCVYDFVWVASPRSDDAGVAAFEGFVQSFRTLPNDASRGAS